MWGRKIEEVGEPLLVIESPGPAETQFVSASHESSLLRQIPSFPALGS
jgi:hypothetical protein